MSSATELPIEGKTLQQLCLRSLKRTREMFGPLKPSNFQRSFSESDEKIKLGHKLRAEYSGVIDLPPPKKIKKLNQNGETTLITTESGLEQEPEHTSRTARAIELAALNLNQSQQFPNDTNNTSDKSSLMDISDISTSISLPPGVGGTLGVGVEGALGVGVGVTQPLMVKTATGKMIEYTPSSMIQRRLASKWPKPEWHPPWVCYRVISGHLGWVRSVAFDPSNLWFCTGSADRTIKIWDTATGTLKITLTGHIEQITGLAVSPRHPYMFSCGLDKMIKCWDMEQNKVIRHYHGHLSGIYALQLHPTMDVLMTGGRDSVCRVWDMRSKIQAHCLSGHDNTVSSIFTQGIDPQVVTASHDSTIRLWDLRKGTSLATLTHHKKSVRSVFRHPTQQSFVSASADNIKKYKLPNGEFIHNMLQNHKSIINAVAVNEDNVLISAGDNGSLNFWDWKSGNRFQEQQSIVQPGSLESEAGVFAMSFDATGSRLVTCEADKTIKMWKEDEVATPETHPVQFEPPKNLKRH